MNDTSEEIQEQLEEATTSGTLPKVSRAMMAYLSGIIGLASGIAGDAAGAAGTIAGGLIAAGAGAWSEHDQEQINKLFKAWLKMQEDEIREIGITLIEVVQRVDQTDDKIRTRMESSEYLKLVRKCFRDWSAAESEEKRVLIRNLLANAASTTLCPDDIISLFIKWIDDYSEAHFRVVREIYKNPGLTRRDIWLNIHGEIKPENSPEADLFKLLVDDLSQGRVIRQHRDVDYLGNFILKQRAKPTRGGGRQYKSAFDDEEEYELTEMGKQFVHYTMNEIVPKISSPQ